jgi:hypothetical protein
MANLEPSKQRRGLVAIDGAMALIVILLVVQIWLLSATLAKLGACRDENFAYVESIGYG